MKKILLSVAALASLAAAAPAMAQPYGDYDRDYNRGYDNGRYYGYERGDNDRGAYNFNARERELAQRIERGRRNGTLSWAEARQLRYQLSQIQYLERRYRVNGLNGRERADLDRRLDRVAIQLRVDMRDRDDGPGWRDRY